MSELTLIQIINNINAKLRSHGKPAVQEVKMTNKEGKVIGQVRYGYRPQYVFDAINEELLPENWRYEVVSKEIYSNAHQAVVEVKLFIRHSDEWLCKGSQCGQMQIVKENVGDAYKGAITDAIQKCFSYMSVGTDSYRGLLEQLYKGTSSTSRPQPSRAQSQAKTDSAKIPENAEQPTAAAGSDELPQITGIEYQKDGDRYIATGKVYDKKDMLKAAGFRWSGVDKQWFRPVAASA